MKSLLGILIIFLIALVVFVLPAVLIYDWGYQNGQNHSTDYYNGLIERGELQFK